MTAPPKRRWFRFSLRTLFVVVTAFGVWLGWQRHIVQERKVVLAEIQRLGSSDSKRACLDLESREVTNDRSWMLPGTTLKDYECIRVPFVRRLLGDASYVVLFLPHSMDVHWAERAEHAFPESRLWIVHYSASQFRDSLYMPPAIRKPNLGTVFKTGLIEK